MMTDRFLFLLISVLITIGIVLSYSLSSYIVILFDYNPFHFALRQSIFAFVSIVMMWAISRLDADEWLHRIGLTLFISGLFLMAVMPFLPPSLVSEVGGAKRWIKVAGLSLAPVEFFKVGFVYFLAWSFRSEERRVGKEFRSRWSPWQVHESAISDGPG